MPRSTRSTTHQLSPQAPAEERRAATPRKRTRAMGSTKDTAPLSDTETAEKPVREQLKKASIAGLPQDMPTSSDGGVAEPDGAERGGEDTGSRGRLQRKRSFEEVEVEAEQPEPPAAGVARSHTRKRSRDSTVEESELHNGQRKISGEKPRDGDVDVIEAAEKTGPGVASTLERPDTPAHAEEARSEVAAEVLASPKTKRSRLHSTGDESNNTLTLDPQDNAASDVARKAPPPDAATNGSSAEFPKTTGFTDTFAKSPFSTFAGSKSPLTETQSTSSSAFASSGFGSLAASTTTGFGAIGKSSGGFGAGGSFATGGKSPLAAEPANENEVPREPTSSAFGGALGQKSGFGAAPSTSSGFASSTSGFGTLGSTGGLGGGFGSSTGGFGGFGGSGGLTSFASGKPSSSLAGGSKPSVPFGASAGDAEEGESGGEDDEAGYKSPPHHQDEKQDERFFAQELETGEEDEVAEYSCRAKLYNFAAVDGGKKEWRERGLGVLRLNVRKDASETDGPGKPKARFLMRADGSHRVVLNTPVKKEISFGAPKGGAPQGGFMYFMGTIDGKDKLELLQLKLRQQFALELYEKVVELQGEM